MTPEEYANAETRSRRYRDLQTKIDRLEQCTDEMCVYELHATTKEGYKKKVDLPNESINTLIIGEINFLKDQQDNL